jgi:hypothetical protein|tara:strand:+ start:349 stop:759 length:411 start_codon:yes stop_codon:yes gene_type:complete
MNKEKLNELYEKYDLKLDTDFWKKTMSGKTFTIVTRSGIEKIQNQEQIYVSYDAVVTEKDFAVIKAIAKKGDKVIETYSSALKGTGGNCFTSYVVEMAEKRAFARAVLKMTDFYQENVFGEDESDDFKQKIKYVKQ